MRIYNIYAAAKTCTAGLCFLQAQPELQFENKTMSPAWDTICFCFQGAHCVVTCWYYMCYQLIWELAFSNYVNWELIGYEVGWIYLRRIANWVQLHITSMWLYYCCSHNCGKKFQFELIIATITYLSICCQFLFHLASLVYLPNDLFSPNYGSQ